jgi:hypothetical protein
MLHLIANGNADRLLCGMGGLHHTVANWLDIAQWDTPVKQRVSSFVSIVGVRLIFAHLEPPHRTT